MVKCTENEYETFFGLRKPHRSWPATSASLGREEVSKRVAYSAVDTAVIMLRRERVFVCLARKGSGFSADSLKREKSVRHTQKKIFEFSKR